MRTFADQLLSLSLTIFALVLPLAAQDPEPTPQPTPVQTGGPAVDATTALRRAADHVAGLKGVKGEARREGMREAAEVYRQIAGDFAGRSDVVARARYEAGECARKAGDLEVAEEDYAASLATEEARYKERAAFQRGSMLRRLKRWTDAVTSYRVAIGVRPKSARADDARIWVARCLEQQGEMEEAAQAYTEAVAAASSPQRGVAACDRQIMFLVRRAELDAAEQVLRRAEEIAAPVLERGGKVAERLRKRLEGMSGRRALQRARDKADDAVGDAEQVEAVTGEVSGSKVGG